MNTADDITFGFREKKWRPWPERADFVIADNHPDFLDLCYLRGDGVKVYLASKKK